MRHSVAARASWAAWGKLDRIRGCQILDSVSVLEMKMKMLAGGQETGDEELVAQTLE